MCYVICYWCNLIRSNSSADHTHSDLLVMAKSHRAVYFTESTIYIVFCATVCEWTTSWHPAQICGTVPNPSSTDLHQRQIIITSALPHNNGVHRSAPFKLHFLPVGPISDVDQTMFFKKNPLLPLFLSAFAAENFNSSVKTPLDVPQM